LESKKKKKWEITGIVKGARNRGDCHWSCCRIALIRIVGKYSDSPPPRRLGGSLGKRKPKETGSYSRAAEGERIKGNKPSNRYKRL